VTHSDTRPYSAPSLILRCICAITCVAFVSASEAASDRWQLVGSLFLPDRSTACDVTQISYADGYSETDMLVVAQRLNEFLEFDGNRRFVTVFRKLVSQLYPIHTITRHIRFIVLLSSKSILGKQVTAIHQIKKDSYIMREIYSLYWP